MDFDLTLIQNASLLAFALVFLGGILTSLGPCNVAMIPLVGWARVYRRRHTWAQVAAGGIVGASVTLTVLAIALGNG
jgi:cytochrome c-type biogenesis protein